MKWLLILIGVISNALASSFVKYGVSDRVKSFLPNTIFEPIANAWLIAGVALYGVAFILYALSLKYFPLSVAHPILTVGSICFVYIISFTVFNENISTGSSIGLILVIMGIVLLATKS